MKLRKYAALVFGLMWVVGYFFPNWRHLMIAASLPSLLYAILLYSVLPESFHFMVTKEKTLELEQWLKKANRMSRNPRLDLTAHDIISVHHRNQHGPVTPLYTMVCTFFKQ
jgi:hypothetical protein